MRTWCAALTRTAGASTSQVRVHASRGPRGPVRPAGTGPALLLCSVQLCSVQLCSVQPAGPQASGIAGSGCLRACRATGIRPPRGRHVTESRGEHRGLALQAEPRQDSSAAAYCSWVNVWSDPPADPAYPHWTRRPGPAEVANREVFLPHGVVQPADIAPHPADVIVGSPAAGAAATTRLPARSSPARASLPRQHRALAAHLISSRGRLSVLGPTISVIGGMAEDGNGAITG